MRTMLLDDVWLVLVAAIVIDAAFGDPAALYRRLPHPVVLLGHFISACESRLRRPGPTSSHSAFASGALTVALTVGLALGVAGAIEYVLTRPGMSQSMGLVVVASLASTLLAARGLHDHVMGVAQALERGIDVARTRIAHIVGRDPDSLDEPGVARAAIESAAENFVDGFVAPAAWLALFGLPGMAAYKAINTLDSMLGHHNARYEYFGKFAARLDDLATLVPAILGGLCLVVAAALLPGARAGRALRMMLAHASRHRSPNAGWSEAAMAGALGFALAGPRSYGGEAVQDAWMGRGRTALDAHDVRRALALYRRAWLVAACLTTLAAVGLHGM